MYAIVKTGGKQYRVEQGDSLLVERLPASEGESVALDPLLYVDGSKIVDQVDGLSSGVKVEARVVAHERGPKLRIGVQKFKPKRGYKRRNGHRQELTRLEVVSIKVGGGRGRGGSKSCSRGRRGEGRSSTSRRRSRLPRPRPRRRPKLWRRQPLLKAEAQGCSEGGLKAKAAAKAEAKAAA